MSNLLDTYIVNQSLNRTSGKEDSLSYTFNTSDKVKPMEEKGKLLPSRIISSPVEYVKDLKKDVVSIGKASKGQANDHELGRINDLAMKLGSLGLAAYLCIKNPLKLNKAMEFTGFAAFFGSMALWPKLAIQAPLKARTGVDIHQKYVDSQGRKKMLFQDPQYDLTDLYSREDLDKMGKKMGIPEDIPDRDSFIKQRAKKTAVQGNTLWMLTAGIASPTLSALICNRLEKPIEKAIEKRTLRKTEDTLYTKNYQSVLEKIKEKFSEKSFGLFLKKYKNKPMDEKMISNISSRLGKKVNFEDFGTLITDELSLLAKQESKPVKFNTEFVMNALKGIIPESVFTSLTEQQKAALDKAIEGESLKGVADVLSKTQKVRGAEQKRLCDKITKTLSIARNTTKEIPPDVSQLSGKIKALYTNITDFTRGKTIIDKYVSTRVGDQSGTYIANQWNRVCNKFIKLLRLNTKELKAVSRGDVNIISDKLFKLAGNDKKYNKAVKELMKLINDYEAETGHDFIRRIELGASDVFKESSKDFRENNFLALAKKSANESINGTIENIINSNSAERAQGAQSSFYRLLQSLEVFKKIQNHTLDKDIENALKEYGKNADSEEVKRLVKVCKDIIMDAKITDHTEKLKSANYRLTEIEYKTVMKVLFGNSSDSELKKSLLQQNKKVNIDNVLKGYRAYKQEFKTKIINWQNTITPELKRYTLDNQIESSNAIARNTIVGKSVNSLVKDAAKQAYNSRKWMQIFGGTMLALTLTTLGIGLALGRKGKTEKQTEKESKING